MKLAIIVPTSYLAATSSLHSGFHMVLGQHLNDKFYYNHYGFLAGHGHSILIDNGAAEPEDEPFPFEKIAAYAEALNADWVILPDKLHDAAWTLDHSIDGARYIPESRRMIVPQGNDPDEWKDCFDELSRAVSYSRVGIPKVCEKWPGGRGALVDWLNIPPEAIHYLGVYAEPVAEVRDAAKRKVGSMDTAAPVAYAQHGEAINDEVHRSLDWNARIPHWEIVEHNTKTLRKVAFDAYHSR